MDVFLETGVSSEHTFLLKDKNLKKGLSLTCSDTLFSYGEVSGSISEILFSDGLTLPEVKFYTHILFESNNFLDISGIFAFYYSKDGKNFEWEVHPDILKPGYFLLNSKNCLEKIKSVERIKNIKNKIFINLHVGWIAVKEVNPSAFFVNDVLLGDFAPIFLLKDNFKKDSNFFKLLKNMNIY